MQADPQGLDPRLLELLHRAADGSASAPELREFEAALESTPGLRTEFEALRDLVSRLNALPPVQPPATLKEDVLAELRRRQDGRRQGTAPVPGLSRTHGRLLAWAAGLLLLAGSAYLVEGRWGSIRGANSAEAAGAMGGREVRSWPIVEGGVPALDPASLRLTVRRQADRFAVEILNPPSADPAGGPITLRWDPKAMECLAVQPGGADLSTLNQRGSAQFVASDRKGGAELAPLVILRHRSENFNPQEVVLAVPGKEYLRATIPAK